MICLKGWICETCLRLAETDFFYIFEDRHDQRTLENRGHRDRVLEELEQGGNYPVEDQGTC